jgi:2-oxoglutarate ferredoxin oxidoreductase subunit beta
MSKQNKLKLETNARNTWCPGCGNFAILFAFKKAINSLIQEGTPREKIVLSGGVGCSSKIVDYLNLNSFCSLHGRSLAVAEGIKIANPKLKVVVFAGDGGTYNEGISHLIHAAKRNIDLTVLVHDNRCFALTTGQFTATSPQGFKGKSTPQGSREEPFNPLQLMLASQASFIARGYSGKVVHLQKIISAALSHPGFSFVEILQPCVSFFNATDFYNQRLYEIKDDDLASRQKALAKIQEWDYQENEKKIPLGIFWQVKRPVY